MSKAQELQLVDEWNKPLSQMVAGIELTTDGLVQAKSDTQAIDYSELKQSLLTLIDATNKELVTDEDFAQAEIDVKTLKSTEEALKAAKELALEKAEEVFHLFKMVDEISECSSASRLKLAKMIKERKDQVKQDAVDEAIVQLIELIDSLHPIMVAREKDQLLSQARAHLEDTAKGKRTSDTLQKALDVSLKVFSDKFNQRHNMITANSDILEAHATHYPALFQDKETLVCTLDLDELKSTIDKRIAAYKEQESENQRAAEAQENELKMRRQMAEQQSAAEPAAAEPEPEPEPVAVAVAVDPPIEAQVQAPTGPLLTYQITIVVSRPSDVEAKQVAVAAKKHLMPGDKIRMHQIT